MTFSLDQFRLDNKVAIVTGAGGRGNSIGRAYVTLPPSSSSNNVAICTRALTVCLYSRSGRK
jgi:hypothetical protein